MTDDTKHRRKPAKRKPIDDEADTDPDVPAIRFNQRGLGAVKDARGKPMRGYNEIDPGSQTPVTRKSPDVGSNPLVDVLILERSRDGSAYRYRLQEIDDPKVLAAATGAVIFESRPVTRVNNGHEFRKALRALRRLRGKHLGIPSIMRF